MQNEAIHIIVKGKVQGVFFRATTSDKAAQLGLKGWVRNLPDGNVEVMAEGEKENLNKLAEWCKIGTDRSVVDSVEIEKLPYENRFTDFQIKY